MGLKKKALLEKLLQLSNVSKIEVVLFCRGCSETAGKCINFGGKLICFVDLWTECASLHTNPESDLKHLVIIYPVILVK